MMFTSPDTLIPDQLNPLDWNRYQYARGNPVNYTDPTGHWVETAFDVISLGMTINDIRNEGFTVMNAVSLVTDVASVVLPIVPAGVSHAIRAAKYADAALTAAKVVDNADEIADGGELLYRSMKMADDGLPVVEKSARGLGARTPKDITPIDGMVKPETGGMSVSPGSPYNLLDHRRPPEYGGTGKDPLWCISTCDVGPDLRYRPDPEKPTSHGFLEPARVMPESRYQQSLAQTRSRWILISK